MNLNYQRPKLYPKQQAFVDDPSRFTWVEAGTKAGKTIGMVIWMHEQCIMTDGKGKNFWWVAPYYGTAQIAFERMWAFIPESIRSMFTRNITQQTITYPGTAHKIWFKSAEKPDALYGEDVYACVIDEASRMREEAWHAIQSTLTATAGRAKIIGNIKGRKNWFYKGAAKAREKGIGFHRLPSKENTFLDPAILAQAKEDLPAHVYAELYDCVPSEDGSNPFGMEFINAAIRPLSTLPPVCFGIDLAKKQDHTVITGLDANCQVCYREKFQTDWGQTRLRILRLPNVPMRLDSTGVGDPITEDIQRERDNVEGFNYSGGNKKQQLMEGLASGIQSGILTFPESYRDEMEHFEFEHTRNGVKYSAPEGMHDDEVNSLALAYSKWQQLTHEEKTPECAWSFS